MISKRTGSRASRKWIALPPLLALALSVHAQVTPKVVVTKDEELQEVVVTGSRIARPELDNLQPTTVLDSKTIDQRGYLDVGQALSQLPQFGVQPSSSANQQGNTGIAQSFVDLYGLGSQRTLTLVNGRRFPSADTASLGNSASNSLIGGPGTQVDLNTVPTKLIDHVETIAVGGAPIYGADAIAGTVNIILKKDYEGIDVDGQVGASGQGDAWNYRARALFGQNFFDNRANITGVAEWTKTDGLLGTDRQIFAQSAAFLPPLVPGQYANVYTPHLSIPAVSFGGVPMVDDIFLAPKIGFTGAAFGVTNAAGQTLAFGPNGTLIPFDPGKNTGYPIFSSGGDGLQLAQVTNLLSPTERINVDILPNFKVNDNLTLFGEGWFSETHATNLVAQPAYNSALFGIPGGVLGGNFVISLNNPFLSPADRQTIATALNNYGAAPPLGVTLGQAIPAGPNQLPVAAWNNQQFYLGRSSIDLQNDGATATQVLARGVLGANGKFSLGDRNYTWDVAGSYGSTSNTSFAPSYVWLNLQNALNATTNAQGQIVCAGNPVNAPISTASSTCAPINIFGNGSPSLPALQYITHLAEATSYNTQRDFSANLQGDVMKLPAGEWKAGVGFENRRESADFSPDAFYTENLGYGTATAVAGSYISNELYLETLIPIFEPAQDIPALHQLEVEPSARRVDNSLAGDATTYTYGMRWSPVEDIQFRGNKTKSIRAPSITELFLPTATTFATAQDPCDMNYYKSGTAPATRLANCEAAGINPATFSSSVTGATVQGLTGGNPDLMSETAYSYTYGAVIRPRWVPKLNMSVDYIDINLKGAISSLTLQDEMVACYDSTNYPNDPACSTFTRNPVTHQVTGFHVGYVNAGILHFSGIQAALDYPFDLPWSLGGLEARAHYLGTTRLDSKIGEASTNSLAGLIGYSKTKINLDLIYTKESFLWDWQGVYIGPAEFSNSSPPNTYEFNNLGGWWVINSTLGYSFTPQFKMQFIVNNVFNKLPPFPALAGASGGWTPATSQYFSGVMGRYLTLTADYKFR
jgi:iron complex outermembrane recepter protein